MDHYKLIVTQGDLTMMPMRDGALINPSNTGLILTSRGLSSQIARRAGPFIQQSLHTARSRLKQGRLEPGQVLDTEPGQLQVKRLIHVAIVGGRKVNKRLISRGLLNALDLADELQLTQVGLPPMGMEVPKFEMAEFLDLFWRITVEELPQMDYLRTVVLSMETEETFQQAKAFTLEHQDELPEEISLEIRDEGIGMGMFGG